MNESKGLVDRIYVDDNTYVTHTTRTAWTGEEYEVATLQVFALDRDVLGILVALGSTNKLVVLLVEHIAGET